VDPLGRDDSGLDPAVEVLTARFAEAVADLVDRVRPLPGSRLLGRPPELGGRSRAAAAQVLAQRFADVAAALEQQPGVAPAAWRAVPDLGPFVVADQLAVTAADLLAAVAATPGPRTVPAADGTRTDLDIVLGQCLAAVTQLRACI
jgi:hypothetical protein